VLSNLISAPGLAGVAVALAYLGCITALAMTGHISGQDALVALGIVGGGATAVTATHVTGNAMVKAAGTAGQVPDGTGATPQQAPSVSVPSDVPTVTTPKLV